MNNKNNDKNKLNFVDFNSKLATDIFEIDAKYLDYIGGGAGGDVAGPIGTG